jgi:hypothetical protein
MFPIKGIHIPDRHSWCCDFCRCTTARWLTFIGEAGPMQGSYLCYDCQKIPANRKNLRGMTGNKVDSFLSKHRNKSIRSAVYEGPAKLRAHAKREPVLVVRVGSWLKRKYGVDSTHREAWLDQSKRNGGALKALFVHVDLSREAAGRRVVKHPRARKVTIDHPSPLTDLCFYNFLLSL